ncbi:hypothetical protein [Sorangium sp. So ce128]|uniref:hypothetical protein n=1 Tax=Sorangium sp. So ce128 TaxID=3133281 RepID=UPI003F603642
MGHEQDSPAPNKGRGQITTTIAIPLDGLAITAAPPELLSQRNVEAVTGIPARVYLDELRKAGFPLKVVRLGKLRLVPRVEFLAWLRAYTAPTRPANDAPGDSVAAVLAEVGCERKRGRG